MFHATALPLPTLAFGATETETPTVTPTTAPSETPTETPTPSSSAFGIGGSGSQYLFMVTALVVVGLVGIGVWRFSDRAPKP
jgi:hypothetical protein